MLPNPVIMRTQVLRARILVESNMLIKEEDDIGKLFTKLYHSRGKNV